MNYSLNFSKSAKEMTDEFFNKGLAGEIIKEAYNLFKDLRTNGGVQYCDFENNAIWGIEIRETAPYDEEIETLITVEKYKARLNNMKENFNKIKNSALNDPCIKQIIERLDYLIKLAENIEIEHFWDKYDHVSNYILHDGYFKENSKISKAILKILRDLKDIRSKLDCSKKVKLLGKFIPAKMKIELYRDTISEEFSEDSDRTDLLACVLCHELFHMFHWMDVQNSMGKWSARRKSTRYRQYKCVKESLARFFEYKFASSGCIGDDVKSKITKWASPTVPLFPYDAYSGSKYLIESLNDANLNDANLNDPNSNEPNKENFIKVIYYFSLINMDTPFQMIDALSKMYSIT